MNLLSENQLILSPSELTQIIRELKEEVAAGTLRQIEGASSYIAGAIELSELAETPPWPDFFELFFADGEGRRFRLFAETYHGQGGEWTIVE